jgi:hypothetical protein
VPTVKLSGAVTAAANPRTVVTATTGSANTLAGMATMLTAPEMITINGAVTRCAAAATATDSATTGGTRRRRSACAQPGAMSSNATVASTDMAKPRSVAS